MYKLDETKKTEKGRKKFLAVHPFLNQRQQRPWSKTSIRDRYDTNRIIYRCFLPDLTGFITVCCVPSNSVLKKGCFAVVTILKRRFCPA